MQAVKMMQAAPVLSAAASQQGSGLQQAVARAVQGEGGANGPHKWRARTGCADQSLCTSTSCSSLWREPWEVRALPGSPELPGAQHSPLPPLLSPCPLVPCLPTPHRQPHVHALGPVLGPQLRRSALGLGRPHADPSPLLLPPPRAGRSPYGMRSHHPHHPHDGWDGADGRGGAQHHRGGHSLRSASPPRRSRDSPPRYRRSRYSSGVGGAARAVPAHAPRIPRGLPPT